MTVRTIGHSTRTPNELLALLNAARIEVVADVRSYPGSRRCPWFGSATMAGWLDADGIGYAHLLDLGGRRRKQQAGDANAGWRNASFRNYADWTATNDWRAALDELKRMAAVRRVAIMCSETVQWRCHRSLISTTLVAQGLDVIHILSASNRRPHVLGECGPRPAIDGGHVAGSSAR